MKQSMFPICFRHASLVLVMVLLGKFAVAATITVNAVSDTIANDGLCTLREAMIAANTNTASGAAVGECAAGQAFPVVDTIAFAIPGAGVHTIAPGTPLPDITESIVIDGYTQPLATANTVSVGNDAHLLIEINGAAVPTVFNVVTGGSGSTIRGLAINRASFVAICLCSSSNNTISGNFIGTNPAGTALAAAAVGGFHIRSNGASNTIGGPTPAARNVLAGAGTSGFYIFLEDTGVGGAALVQGNYIGTNAAGSTALADGSNTSGIVVQTSGNTIGGSTGGAGNVVNVDHFGIFLAGGSTGGANNVIRGNRIGTNAEGTARLTGAIYGIAVSNNGNGGNNTFGGTGSGDGNQISGNSTGMILSPATLPSTVQGNKIGTDVTGTRPIPNSSSGIVLDAPGLGSHIGGTTAGAGNTIAFNGGHGITITDSPLYFGWAIQGNSIFSNGGLGISLSGVTPTPNDTGDGDTGANNHQNYPVISSASLAAGNVTISASLNSSASMTFRIEFFGSPLCDPSGNGEGKTFLGSFNATTDATGNKTFGPLNFAVPSGLGVFTATATDSANNTSEFSACAGLPKVLDIDGNGGYDALTDGLLLIRYLFGLSGPSLISGAVGLGASRMTEGAIQTYLQTLTP